MNVCMWGGGGTVGWLACTVHVCVFVRACALAQEGRARALGLNSFLEQNN